MPEILIVGGAGYIGSHVILELLENNQKIIVLDDLSTGNEHAVLGGCFYHGCMSDKKLLNKIFNKHNVSVVMLLAGSIDVNKSIQNPALYYRNNVSRTLVLLEAMIQHNVLKIIFSSTAALYKSSQKKIPITFPTNPTNPYAKSKLMVEEILKDYDSAYGMKHIVFRYFNAAGADLKGRIGYHEPATHLIPQALNVASGEKQALAVFGNDYATHDGSCIRDFVHVMDLASAHRLAFHKLMKINKSYLYNLGYGNGYSVLEVVKMVKKVTKIDFDIATKPRRQGDIPSVVADPSQAIRFLRWKPKYSSLENIIKHAWQWKQINEKKYN